MCACVLPSEFEWGHPTHATTPSDIVAKLVEETEKGLAAFEILPAKNPCTDRDGFFRVSAKIPLPEELFDQLMNGASGYRAHYSVSSDCGEKFNRQVVETVGRAILESEQCYFDGFPRPSCDRSVLGRCSKIWYSTSVTDVSANALAGLPEEIRIERWVKYWDKQSLRKGLLAPRPLDSCVLFNGTFVNDDGEIYEQKQSRAEQIYKSGWD